MQECRRPICHAAAHWRDVPATKSVRNESTSKLAVLVGVVYSAWVGQFADRFVTALDWKSGVSAGSGGGDENAFPERISISPDGR